MPVGRAIYAVENPTFPCSAFLRSVANAKEIRISFVWHSFRSKVPNCLDELTRDRRLTLIQIQAMNETCLHRRDCARGEFLYGVSFRQWEKKLAERHLPTMVRARMYYAKVMSWLTPLPPSVQCLIVPSLESRLNDKAAKTLWQIAKETFGARCQVGWNPLTKMALTFAPDFVELHGLTPTLTPPCVANPDGAVLPYGNKSKVLGFLRAYAKCQIFLWTGADNCGGPQAGEPKLRKCKPDKEFVLAGSYL